MTAPRPRWFEDVTVGETLPPLEFDVTLTSLVMYAGATWDFHRYHYDPEFVAKLGMPAPFMDGQMVGALMARQLMQWGGADAFVRKLNYRQRGTVYAGDRIVLRGTVSDKSVDERAGAGILRADRDEDGWHRNRARRERSRRTGASAVKSRESERRGR